MGRACGRAPAREPPRKPLARSKLSHKARCRRAPGSIPGPSCYSPGNARSTRGAVRLTAMLLTNRNALALAKPSISVPWPHLTDRMGAAGFAQPMIGRIRSRCRREKSYESIRPRRSVDRGSCLCQPRPPSSTDGLRLTEGGRADRSHGFARAYIQYGNAWGALRALGPHGGKLPLLPTS